MVHDHLFKELFSVFFREFIALFLPDVAAYLDDDFVLVPLNKELFTDITVNDSGEVDLLMKCRFRGKKTYFLIHVENEAKKKSGFSKRMFWYFALLDHTYDLPVYPVVVFSYDSPKNEAQNCYEVAFPNRFVLKFDYEVIQLNRLSWRDFINHPNPVASALMAKMKMTARERPKVKTECLRMLMNLKLDPAKTRLIGVFIDTYLDLNAREMKQFEREMNKLVPEERDATMEMMTSWERKGLEQGRLEGRNEGRQEGEQKGREDMLALFIEQQFSTLPAGITERLDRLTSEQLNELGKALFRFTSLTDLESWLELDR